MDPELRKKLYIEKHKPAIITTGILVFLLPVMVVVSQLTTQFQPKAAERADNPGFPQQKPSLNAVSDLNYSLLMKCFDKPNQTNPCTQTERNAADLNNDGVINGVDYNSYIRQAKAGQ